ncbi:MAG: phage tail protein [Bacteroidota bacterium]
MAQFQINTHRYDPYKNFKFRVRWDGRVVAGISKVSAIKMSTEVVEHREGGDLNSVRKAPGQSSFEAITLERGVTHDRDFENWASTIWNQVDGYPGMSLKNFRKDITIELLNLQGSVVKAYNVFRCWVSEYQAMPELDANGNAVAIEMMVLQNEGWQRDMDVVEPQEF